MSKVIENQLFKDASMGADQTSAVFDINYMKSISFEIKFSGTPTGVFKVQCSNSKENWVDYPEEQIDGLAENQPAGSADTFIIDLQNLNTRYIRLFYDRTSGDGTLNTWAVAKER